MDESISLYEQRQAVRESLKMLATHEPFQTFIGEVKKLREMALAEACADKSLQFPNVTSAYLGEIRAFTDICNLADDFRHS